MPPKRARARARADSGHGHQDAAFRAIAAALAGKRMEEILLRQKSATCRTGAEAEVGEGAARPPAPGRGTDHSDRARRCRQIAALPDPVGEVIEGQRLPNGLDVRKVRVPLGVVAVVYEARPNVTIDAAALCLKSGNAIVLRGSSLGAHSNAALRADRRRCGRGGRTAGRLRKSCGGRRSRGAGGAGHAGRHRRSHHPARR